MLRARYYSMQNCNKDLFKPYNSKHTSFFVQCPFTQKHLMHTHLKSPALPLARPHSDPLSTGVQAVCTTCTPIPPFSPAASTPRLPPVHAQQIFPLIHPANLCISQIPLPISSLEPLLRTYFPFGKSKHACGEGSSGPASACVRAFRAKAIGRGMSNVSPLGLDKHVRSEKLQT
jgi:hypothetical protein